ncbi:hypothetical protein EB118_23255 [bacterium]|nr:hypothetical protein [bacterium]
MAQFRKDTHQYLNDGRTIFEVVMLADQYGNLVGPSNPAGMAVDAFGRSRQSQPYTLFESSYRYEDNGLFATANSASGGSSAYAEYTQSFNMTVTTAADSYVYRESKKVFAYQPGKSLQILNTFVMDSAKAGLRQRVGYFDDENGLFLERNGASQVRLVKRSKVTGSVVDTPVEQSDWNIDKLDGTGPSLLTLNLDNPQIFFVDMEWLGVGSVRFGFAINGQLIWCHSIHHANLDLSPKGAYMQTACLPVRYEIYNTSSTASGSTLKQICSTVISEGGYQYRGQLRTFGTNVAAASQFRLTTIGTYYPVLAFRLNPSKNDAVILPEIITAVPINNGFYRYKIISNPTISGATWANTSGNSAVQYNSNTSATVSGGIELTSGYMTATTQASQSFNIGNESFRFQLERDGLANTSIPLVLAISSDTATVNVVAQMTWQEVTS